MAPLIPLNAGERRRAVVEASSTSIFRNLVGHAFLMPLALHMGAGAGAIGLIGAAPFMGRLLQLAFSRLIHSAGARVTSLWAGAIDRLLVMFVASTPFWLAGSTWAPYVIAGTLVFSAAAGELYNVANACWLAERTRPTERGAFLAARTAWASGFGLAANLAAAAVFLVMAGTSAAGGSLLGTTIGVGSLVGLAGVFVMRSIPALPDPIQLSTTVRFRESFLQAIHHGRFRRFLRFQLSWHGAVHLSSAFFLAFAVQVLGFTPFHTALMIALHLGAGVVVVGFWGRIADQFGNKVVTAAAGFWATLLPFLWILLARPATAWTLFALELVSGAAWAGLNLAQANAIVRLSPQELRASFVALFTGLLGVVGLAPLLGGAIIGGLTPRLGTDAYLVLFALSGTLRFLALISLRHIPEPGGRSLRHSSRVLSRTRVPLLSPAQIGTAMVWVPVAADSVRRTATREAKLLAKRSAENLDPRKLSSVVRRRRRHAGP
jgi:hypothetical protein